MAHFAHIDSKGYVDSVIVVEPEQIELGEFGNPSEWIQTSYNTFEGEHIDPVTKEKMKDNALRGNYAGVGDFYNKELDAFVPPKPHTGWQFNSEKCKWLPPIECPNPKLNYRWHDEKSDWILTEDEQA